MRPRQAGNSSFIAPLKGNRLLLKTIVGLWFFVVSVPLCECDIQSRAILSPGPDLSILTHPVLHSRQGSIEVLDTKQLKIRL